MRKDKLIKENMNTLMSLIEATDTIGISIVQLSGDSAKDFEMKFLVLKKALMDTKYREQAVDEMLTDLLVAAYRDRVALAYVPTFIVRGTTKLIGSGFFAPICFSFCCNHSCPNPSNRPLPAGHSY